MSGRLGGVPGGESRFRLLVIIREAASRRKEESLVRQGPGKGGQDGEGHLRTEWAVLSRRGGLGRACLPGTSPAQGGPFLKPRPDEFQATFTHQSPSPELSSSLPLPQSLAFLQDLPPPESTHLLGVPAICLAAVWLAHSSPSTNGTLSIHCPFIHFSSQTVSLEKTSLTALSAATTSGLHYSFPSQCVLRLEVHACSVNSAVSDSKRCYGLQPARLLSPWDSPGKNTGVGSHVLLQGVFPTQGLKPHLLQLLHCRWVLYLLSHQGSPLLLDIQAHLSVYWQTLHEPASLGRRHCCSVPSASQVFNNKYLLKR